MNNDRRVFLIVMDSVGCGEMSDSAAYGDAGSNTLAACAATGELNIPNLTKLGIFNIDNVGCGAPVHQPIGCFGRLAEASKGKDTTIGHWEISGVVSPRPMPTYPDGFPQGLLEEYSRRTGRGILCNKPYSGTQVILDYGRQQKETGDLIVYTSADSVFQVAAHEEWIGLEELYRCCEIARELLVDEHAVGRVIARPFVGEYPNYTRTANRHDYSLEPPKTTLLDALCAAGKEVLAVGKINDIFAGRGITEFVRTQNNDDGMDKTLAWMHRDFSGLCFVNLVDFDMIYGHRNDAVGYARALNRFDERLGSMLPDLRENDLLIVTADHGCDPATESTDHSREHVPLLVYGSQVKKGVNLGTGTSFANIASTIAEYLDITAELAGESFLKQIMTE